jgi:Transposase IS116/IS110/IS902 family
MVMIVTESQWVGIDVSQAWLDIPAVIGDSPIKRKISSKQLASLVGIAPLNCDSGKMRGKRHILGGR